jgi:iron complex transport system substrate-binding protein
MIFSMPFSRVTKPILFAMGFLFFITQAQAKEQSRAQSQKQFQSQPKTPPQRIVSLNMCIDQLLWQLVPHERLSSLSYLSANPLWSPIADELKNSINNANLTFKRGLILNHGLAEEIMPLQPDLILAGEYDARDALNLLQKLEQRVERLAIPEKLDDIQAQIIQLGELVGAESRAQHLVSEINSQLATLKSNGNQAEALTAFWYSSNGIVIGAGTLENELMHFAGLRNLAAEQGLYGFVPLDLELLLSAQPRLLIVEESNTEAFSLAREYLSHPALAAADFSVIELPGGLSGCAAAVVGDVALALQQGLKQEQQRR